MIISNAFALSMLPAWMREADEDGPITLWVAVRPILDPASLVREALEAGEEIVSCVGHADTARIFSGILGIEVAVNRTSITLTPEEDLLLVGQYQGPRLPEGATQLPEGAEIAWYLVEVQGAGSAGREPAL